MTDFSYITNPAARGWAEANPAAAAAVVGDITTVLGSQQREAAAVTAWVAATSYPGDSGQQQREIHFQMMSRHAGPPSTTLSERLGQALTRHLPLPAAPPPPRRPALAAVNEALTAAERNTIAAGWADANPDYCDLNADDVLEVLYDADAHLDIREPFAEANPDLARLPGEPFAVLALIRLRRPVTRPAVVTLLARARLLDALTRPDIAAFAGQVAEDAGQGAALAAVAGQLGSPALAATLRGYSQDLLKAAQGLNDLAREGL